MTDEVGSSTDEFDQLPLPELRARRDELEQEETAISYTRRLLQGHLDIVSAEIARRDAGGSPSQLSEIIDSLPEALAGGVQGGSLPRPMLDVPPTERVNRLLTGLGLPPPGELVAGLAGRSDDDLRELGRSLHEAEVEVSSRRRAVHRLIDAVHAEIVRRYRSGEATVDALLG